VLRIVATTPHEGSSRGNMANMLTLYLHLHAMRRGRVLT